MSLLICAATMEELIALAPAIFSSIKELPEQRPIPVQLKELQAYFLITGTGPVNAAFATGHALGALSHEASVTGTLCLGLASAFNLDIAPLCSIWTVSHEIWPEYGLNDGIRITARAFSLPLWDNGWETPIYDEIPLSSLEDFNISPEALAWSWPECSALTVAGSTASFNRRDFLWDHYHAPLENMEGFAVAYAALRLNLPCAEIRVVSTKAGPRSREEKDQEGALAALSKVLPGLGLL